MSLRRLLHRSYGRPNRLGLAVFSVFWLAAGVVLDAAWCAGQVWKRIRRAT